MRLHVVSDVHGNVDALARAADGADALLVLGDLIDFVDYHDHSGGILGSIFGAEKVAVFAALRRERRSAEIVSYVSSLWGSLADPGAVVEEAIREQYAKLFAALTAPTYATPGNVDMPELWPEYAGDNVRILDGTVTEIGGLRFGFVGGGQLPPTVTKRRRGGGWRPYLRTAEEYTAAVRGLDPVDVVCTHIPPDLPELTYDVLARRAEYGSAGLLELIRERAPRASLFGHVHQPLAARMRVGRTECANVGHFQRAERPYVLRW
ncbi:MAG TPA: metallophosphoesterase [Actinophytocola sp.]|uniref:metallophosphoesterase family protein n=1 Tax=Actinophytocola sp. TaxID=1872138 RepID=UPI002DBDD06A|nr:metallophosphoesterase [Actinophytocola sp.]HEU5473985.1 metallophosphoesterase [Actinophytocola sp.]